MKKTQNNNKIVSKEKKEEYIIKLNKIHDDMLKINYNIYFLIIPTIALLILIFYFVNLINFSYLYKIIIGVIVFSTIFYFSILSKIRESLKELKVLSVKRDNIRKEIRNN